MKTWTIVGAGLGLLMAGGVAMAQNAPPAPGPQGGPPGGPAAQMDQGQMDQGPEHDGMMHGFRGRHAMWERMHGRGMMMPPPPPNKAAVFRFRKGDASVFIKCAEAEPTTACVDAASKLMDKLDAHPR